VYPHVVLIGGTGMLAGAGRSLARRCGILTSIARSERSLHALDRTLGDCGCRHRMLALDWSEPDAFVRSVVEHVRRADVTPSLVLAWLHDDELGAWLASALAPSHTRCAFFHVRGSAAADPARDAQAFAHGRDMPATIDYRQVILGFRSEDGRSRWLHDAEIVAGVLDAIACPREVTVVGTVVPWSSRP
jgi:hypothetical protein